MTTDFKLLKTLPKGAIYKINNPACLTTGNMLKLPWTENTWGFSFILPKHAPIIPQVLGERLSDYGVTIEYEVQKQALNIVEASGADSGISVEPITNPEEHHDLFIRTYAAYFWAEWPEAVDSFALTMIADYLDKVLPSAFGVKVIKRGIISGMLSYFPKKDENGQPIDWIGWIWLDKSLSHEERKDAQHELCVTIKQFKQDRIRCAVRSWNDRSHGLFKKLGFNPVSVTILKKRKTN